MPVPTTGRPAHPNRKRNTLNEQQQDKIVQYLNEAHATELALVRDLQAQIAMTPSGRYRNGWRSTSRKPAFTPSASRSGSES